MLDKDLFQTKHSAIYDPEFQKHLAEAPWKEWLSKPGYFEVQFVGTMKKFLEVV